MQAVPEGPIKWPSPAEKKGKVSERERFSTLSEFYVNFASEIFPNRAFSKISDSFPNVPVTRSEAFWSLSEVSHYLVHSEFFSNNCPTNKLKIQNYETIFG